MHEITQIRFENCKVFIASEGHIPLILYTRFQTKKICKVLLIIIQTIFCMFQSIIQEMLGLLNLNVIFELSQTICFKIIKSFYKTVDNFEIVLKTCLI